MNHITTARIASGTAVTALILIGGVVSAQSAAFSSQFGVGAQGSNVTSLQTWLTDNGYYSGPITGYYGSLTQAAVERYQAAQGISATGYVGPLTLAALNNNASAGGSTTLSASERATEITDLEAQLNAVLAQLQALNANTTTQTTTSNTAPFGSSLSLQTNAGVGVNATLGATGTGPFTYTITSNPLNGTVGSFNSSTGTFTYTPNTNYTGRDTFSYTVSNSAGVSAPMTVTVNVGSSNVTPNGQAFSFTTQNGAAYNGSLSASGSTPYTYAISSQPSHGSISSFNSSTGAFTYTPNVNYTGSDTFTYTVTNSAGVSSPVTITVNNGSASSGVPTGQTLSYTSTNDASVNGNLSASGTGPFTYAIVSSPTHGTVSSFTPLTGAFTYTPNASYHGSDSFTYTVSNGSGTSAIYTVNLTD
jgi:peptidoglycan hydrolase-like protein with peptidoglycan-binding domain